VLEKQNPADLIH